MSGTGTRIASISGLRGVVGDGLDPATWWSSRRPMRASASRGRSSSAMTAASRRRSSPGRRGRCHRDRPRRAARRADRDADHRLARARPTRRRAASRSRRRTTRPEVQRPKVLPAGRAWSWGRRQGRAMLDRWKRRDFGWASWDELGHGPDRSRIPTPGTWHASSRPWTSTRSVAREFTVVLDACHGAGGGWARLAPGPGLHEPIVLGGEPDGRYDHPPEPTEANLQPFARARPGRRARRSASPRTPTPTAWRSSMRTGRYIGEELTLALAALAPLDPGERPGGAQPVDLAGDRGSGRASAAR